jgi:hypothetical protein
MAGTDFLVPVYPITKSSDGTVSPLANAMLDTRALTDPGATDPLTVTADVEHFSSFWYWYGSVEIWLTPKTVPLVVGTTDIATARFWVGNYNKTFWAYVEKALFSAPPALTAASHDQFPIWVPPYRSKRIGVDLTCTQHGAKGLWYSAVDVWQPYGDVGILHGDGGADSGDDGADGGEDGGADGGDGGTPVFDSSYWYGVRLWNWSRFSCNQQDGGAPADTGDAAVPTDARPPDAGMAPVITSFTPEAAPEGRGVTIRGMNFLLPYDQISVSFNGTPVVPGSIIHNKNNQQLDLMVPTGATDGPITVTTAYGTATSAKSFKVYHQAIVTSLVPNNGKAGDTIMVLGKNFSGTSRVGFQGINPETIVDAASFSVVDDTHLSVVVAGDRNSTLTIWVDGVYSPTSTARFYQAPRITSVCDNMPNCTGPWMPGTYLLVKGVNFSDLKDALVDGQSVFKGGSSEVDIGVQCPLMGTGNYYKVTLIGPGGMATAP